MSTYDRFTTPPKEDPSCVHERSARVAGKLNGRPFMPARVDWRVYDDRWIASARFALYEDACTYAESIVEKERKAGATFAAARVVSHGKHVATYSTRHGWWWRYPAADPWRQNDA